MWSIDQLRLTLPAGFEGRAERIGRLLAEELAELPAPRAPLNLATLTLSPIALDSGLDAGLGDREIAARIARQVGHHVSGLAAPRAVLKEG